MADCFYHKNGLRINNVRDVISEFFKDTHVLKNAAIFSADEIQESTIKEIRKIPGINDYKDSKKEEALKFISTNHKGLYDKIGIDTKNGLLVPEYIEENRIYHYVLDNIKKVEDLSDNVDVSNLEYSQEKLAKLRNHTDLDTYSDNKLIILLSKIESEIKFEEKTKEFGTLLHKVVSDITLNKSYKNTIFNFLNNPENAEILGNFSKQEWFEKIESIANEILSKVLKTGKPISEIFIMTDKTPVDSNGLGIKGKIDLVAVDKSGDAHIFEIKISKTKYENWDSAKKLTLDWQLAIYRQLLGQHINVNKTMLYVIPVWMNSLGDPNGIFVQEFANRKSESKSGLNESGIITKKANILIPRKVFVDYDPERIKTLTSQLNSLIPDYEVKTNIEDYDVEKIMINAKKRYEREKVWKKWNNFEDVPGISKGYIEAESEEEFRKKIEDYVAHVKTQVNRNVSILKDAIISAIKTNSSIKTNSYNEKTDLTTNHILKEYLNDEWDVVDSIPEALAMGLIILKNNKTGNVNILSLSINQFYADSNIPNKNYGDIEILKSFLFLNMFKSELLLGEKEKIAQIIAYNPINNTVYTRNSMEHYNNFRDRMYEVNLQNSLNIVNDDIAGIEDIALYNLDVNLRKFNGSDKKDIDIIFNKFRDTNFDQIDLENLLEIQKAFYEKWGDYKLKTLEKGINFEDPKEIILALLQTAIVSKKQMELTGDFKDMSKYSLGFSDFKSLFAALYTENRAKYDKEGRKIQGIVQGLLWTTPDWVSSKDLKNINQIMSTSNQHIGEKMVRVSETIYGHTKKFYKAINFSSFNRNVIGDTQTIHKRFWKTDKNGEVSLDWTLKNPYILDEQNSLSLEESEYLKNMLFFINIWRENISDEQAKKLNVNSLESLKTNAIFNKKIEDGSYFKMPLVRREEITKYSNAMTLSPKFWKEKGKYYMQEVNDAIDNRGLLKDDISYIEKERAGFYEMYDVYGRQSPEFIAKNLEQLPTNYFEWNLDTIASRIAFSKIRKNVYDKSLPIINAYVWWMKLLAGRDNADISNQLEYVRDQLGLSVYDEPNIDAEFKDFAIVSSTLKSIATAGMLAFKPAAFFKEMTIGVFKGISLAATEIYGKDQFTIKDLAAAYKKLATIDNKFASEFNLIDRLNQFYRFANMDVNTIAQKLQTDRRGLFRGLGRYMYMANTTPDYYNRLSIFLAKMIHDGSYEAHSLENGIFKYNPYKDRRFSHYLNNRNKYKKDGKYIPAVNDSLYNKQRRTYLLLLEQLKHEYDGSDLDFSEEYIIEKAYSEKERTSMKSFTDMAYGYYDKDAQSQANNTWWGIAWLQFMQFWPGKMKMWFASSTEESPMGKITQDFVEDENKNKQLLYFKTVENEDGSFSTKTTTEDTGDPVLKWTGAPYEGLYYSLVGTIKDIVKMDFSHIKNSEERNRRALFALADAGLMFLLFGLIKALLDAMIEENGTEGFSGYLLNMSSAVNNKVLNEYNVYQSTLGAVNSEPIFLSWGRKMANDTWSALNGDKEITDVMTRNLGAAEVFKW